MQQLIDLRALEIFRTVANEGSVSKAASKLNRVQSNVSTRIKQLEEQLGKDLFFRKSRGLVLTPDGEMMLSYADRLISLSEEATEAINEGNPNGTLRIGAMESTASARLPAVLSQFIDQHPGVEIALETGTTGALLEKLNNHELDAVFVAEPVAFKNLSTQPVFKENLVVVAPKTFPELDAIEEISGKTVIAFEDGCAYRRYIEEWLLESGIVPGRIMAVSSYLSILACVSAGMGFALVPQSVLDLFAGERQFHFYSMPKKYHGIRTMLTWRSDYQSAKLEALKAFL